MNTTADVDVIVIGAGFAGLVAARELGRAGLDVIVLEARDRVGGRTWTDRRMGHDLELGGTWVHWVQPHTWAEMTRYQRDITRSPAVEEVFWLGAGDLPYRGSLDEFMALIAVGQQQLIDDVGSVIPCAVDPTTGAIRDVDALSIQERFDSLDLDPESRRANESVWVGHMNARLDEVGLASAMRWVAAAGGHWQLMHEASATYRVVGGMSAWTRLLADDVPGEIRLGTAAVRVVQHPDSGTVSVVTHDAEVLRARRVISTLPINAIRGIDFEPTLPAVWNRAADETVASQGTKVWMKVRGSVPRFFAYASQAHPLSVLKSEYYGQDDQGEYCILVAFGPDHEQLDLSDVGAVQAAVNAFRGDLSVVEVAAHDWMKDPFSRNTWMTHRPGQLTRDHGELRKPHGLVHFGTTDNANLWAGFIDGAIESGLREAKRIREELCA